MNRELKRQNTGFAFACALGAFLVVGLGKVPDTWGGKAQTVIMFAQPGAGINASHQAWTQRLVRWAFKKSNASLVSKDIVSEQLLFTRTPDKRTRRQIQKSISLLKRGRSLFEDKGRIFKNRRFPYSLKALRKAERLAIRHKKWLKDSSLLRNIYLYQSINYVGMRKAKIARSLLMKAIQFDPHYEMEGSQFPAFFVKYHKVIRDWFMKRADYRVAVRTLPRGAKVYFNTRLVGTSPVLIREIPPGQHTIRIERAGYTTWRKVMNFDPQKLGRSKLFRNPPIPLKLDPKTLSLQGLALFESGTDKNATKMRLKAIQNKLGVDLVYAFKLQRVGGKHQIGVVRYQKGGSIQFQTMTVTRARRSHRRAILRYVATQNKLLAVR